jgi:hypothetical protein
VNHPGVPCGGGCPRRTTAKGGICRRCVFKQKQAAPKVPAYAGRRPARELVPACNVGLDYIGRRLQSREARLLRALVEGPRMLADFGASAGPTRIVWATQAGSYLKGAGLVTKTRIQGRLQLALTSLGQIVAEEVAQVWPTSGSPA